jgi:parallel beta-helix repeat protein
MHRTIAILLGTAVLTLGFHVTRRASTAADDPAANRTIAGRIAGVRPVIDAALYPDLQSALSALPAEGGVVQLPAGRFEITKPLVLERGEVLIRGYGPATHIVNTNTDGEPALVIRVPGADKDRALRPWRVQLADFRLTGNDASGPGLVADRVNEILLENLTVTHHGSHGIVLDQCYEDPRVQSCLLTYNKGTGLEILGCHDIVVNGCQFEENVDGLRCLDGFNLCATGNCFDDHLGPEGHGHGIVVENTYGSVVSGNMIEECTGTGIVLDRDCYGITLSANVIAHDGLGIDLRDAHGCAVSANTFTIMHGDALRIGPGSGRITVTGNNFSNSYLGDGQVKRAENDRDAGGLNLDGTREIAITGNVFSGLRPKGVTLERPSESIMFRGNVLVDAPTDNERAVETGGGSNLIVR